MIPKTFHRIFLDDPIPEKFEAFWATFRAIHVGWEFVTWGSETEARAFVSDDELWDAVDPMAGRADVLRYHIIAKLGGVYVDTDVEPLRPFDGLVDGAPFVGWENDERLCPTVIGGEPEHPALADLLVELREWALARPDETDPVIQTGPIFLTEAWRKRDDVRRLPISAFYPVGYWEKQLLGKVAYLPETYAVHHWAAGWK